MSIAIRADAYGIPGESVDENNVLAAFDLVRLSVDRARRNEGPSGDRGGHKCGWTGTLFMMAPNTCRGHSTVSGANGIPSDIWRGV
jgi:hypothetical protein